MRPFEIVDDEMAAVLRAKTGAQRLAIANELFLFARRTIVASLREAHPDWDEAQIQAEASRRIAQGDTMSDT